MSDEDTPSARLEAALEMWEDGVCLMREQLQRRHPSAAPAEIEARVSVWLATRPGAEAGDAEGVPTPFPRAKP